MVSCGRGELRACLRAAVAEAKATDHTSCAFAHLLGGLGTGVGEGDAGVGLSHPSNYLQEELPPPSV